MSNSEDGHVEDVTFYSPSLRRNMQYRALIPNSYFLQPGTQSRVLYLLHGRTGHYSDWHSHTHVARKANIANYILIMPQGDDSYYVNAALKTGSRYEDYITKDLVKEVEQHYRVIPTRQSRAIAGSSMGGFGAVTIALRHPDMYYFAGALSAPFDAPERRFSFSRMGQYFMMTGIFGLPGSASRRSEDPFLLIQSFYSEAGSDSRPKPYLFIACGLQDPLLEVNRSFLKQVEASGLPHFYSETPGGHDWQYWDSQSPVLMEGVVYANLTYARQP